MSKSFDLDLTQFISDLHATEDLIAKGAREGLQQALDDWVRESRDIAPISPSGGTLRHSITAQPIEGSGLNMEGVVTANANEGGFNYAYYIHEVTGHAVTGEAKFLDKPITQNRDKYIRWIEEDIQDAVKKAGW